MVLPKTPIVALVGNPNTGKTTLFNALAGMRQRTGNYPGVTVETKKGRLRHDGRGVDVIDLPGTYSLAPRSPDEMVAVDLILGRQAGEARPDVVGHTERKLGELAGERVAAEVKEARLRLAEAGCAVPAVEARVRYGWIRAATAGCVQRPAQRPVTWTDRLDRVLTHRLWGTLIFLALMFVVFQSIFTWARPLMKLIGTGKDWLAELLQGALPPGPLASLLIDGVLEGVGGVLVFLPQ